MTDRQRENRRKSEIAIARTLAALKNPPAEVLRANTRSVDIAGRYGGEEFVLFLPETTDAKATHVIERMQQHFRMPTEATGGRALTFSAGIAQAPRDGNDFDVLCYRADAAMYAAKRAGKAQVLSWRPGLENR